MLQPVQLVIGVPTYGGVTPEHAGSLVSLQGWLQAHGVRTQIIHHNLTEIAKSRNKLAARFLDQDWATHLLFIDSDMEFEPAAVEALIRAGKPLIGAVYPKRALHLDRLIAAARKLDDPKEIMAAAMDFVVVPRGDDLEIVDGACRVNGVGMGLCLIERRVFAELRATGRIREDRSPAVMGGLKPESAVHGFFDPLVIGTDLISEDLSFCTRWRELCGGEVWAVLDQEIGHVGPMVYRSRIIDAFEAGAKLSQG